MYCVDFQINDWLTVNITLRACVKRKTRCHDRFICYEISLLKSTQFIGTPSQNIGILRQSIVPQTNIVVRKRMCLPI